MTDYESLRQLIMPTHGVLGLVAIGLGLAALLVPKRPPVHPWAGRSFMLSMAVTIAISAPLIAIRGNIFLLGVGLLVLYHMAVAWRLARLKPPARLPGRFEQAIHPVFGVAFVIYAGYGIRLLAAGSSMGLIPVVLSAISLIAVAHFWRFMRSEEFEEGQWIGAHIRGVAAAFIASITAFTAAIGPRFVPNAPLLLLWLGPTIVLTPVFVWIGFKVQLQLRANAEAQTQAEAEASSSTMLPLDSH